MFILKNSRRFHVKDLLSGIVVFLVALPLCLGIALASGAPIISGIIAGIVGGIVVGFLSGSHISVAGPAAGLTAVILVQLDQLSGSYAAFLLCIIFAGCLQIIFGLFKLGFFANFIPNNVILGLLAAIGVILIMTQLPYLLGISAFSWEKILTETPQSIFSKIDSGAALIGLLSVALLLVWDNSPLKKLTLPSALVTVVAASLINFILVKIQSPWAIQPDNLIQLDNFKGGYCGISKIEQDLYCLCYLAQNKYVKKYGSIKAMEENVLYQNQHLKHIFQNSAFVWSQPEVINEISFERKSLIETHILMCGDTAGMIAPLCGNGMAIAIHSGKILADSIIKNCSIGIDKNIRFNLEQQYQIAWNNQFATRLKVGRGIQNLFGNNFLTQMAINGLNLFPTLAKQIVKRTHGKPF